MSAGAGLVRDAAARHGLDQRDLPDKCPGPMTREAPGIHDS